jgi:hypothetical protein
VTRGGISIIAAGLNSALTATAAFLQDPAINTDLLWKIAAELPIVLLFAFFVFKLIDRFDKIARERDTQWLTHFADEQARNRDNWKRFHDGLAETARAIDRNTTTLLYHDATVRGVDPKASGSFEDLIRILRGKSSQ